jgi:predicted DCC family thiol-disulfide oxidoreductase YuxK
LVSPEPEAAVLYDRDCGFCRWSLDKVLAWDKGGRLRPVEIQSEEGQALLEAAGVLEPERLDSWHLATRSGELLSAGAAAAPLAELLPGGRPLAGVFRRFPRTTERAYRLVSSHREPLARLLRIDATCEIRR